MVVVAFTAPGDLRVVLEELTQHPSPPRQWIGSEAWVTDPDVLRFRYVLEPLDLLFRNLSYQVLENMLWIFPLLKWLLPRAF